MKCKEWRKEMLDVLTRDTSEPTTASYMIAMRRHASECKACCRWYLRERPKHDRPPMSRQQLEQIKEHLATVAAADPEAHPGRRP